MQVVLCKRVEMDDGASVKKNGGKLVGESTKEDSK